MNSIVKTFSELSNQDLYEILQLRSEIFVVEQNCVYNDLDGLDLEGLHMYIEKDNQIVAYVRLLKPGTRFPDASIGRVITKLDYRNKGLSTAIMKEAILYLQKEWNADTIKISAQKYLQKFYENLGFSIVTDEYLEDGIPHYGMILNFI
ncbi:MAG: GNAT family N-acetyltransferase [Prolixibacteraceae bacterium]|jgi:ElaA protein|nr:GNAT family N-acetyltransferase [Prolixibacteraceae bacterium]